MFKIIKQKGSIALLLLFSIAACTKKTDNVQVAEVDLSFKGESIYKSNCISCHNIDPKLDGAVGPKVFGASKELLETRVLSGTYPEGYKPLRTTRLMQPLVHLKDDIPALHAYLNK